MGFQVVDIVHLDVLQDSLVIGDSLVEDSRKRVAVVLLGGVDLAETLRVEGHELELVCYCGWTGG